jgi:outer membrane protein W
MKKSILSLALVAMGLAAFAQKPAAGDKTVEFNLNFQTGAAAVNYGNGVNSLGAPELRFRYFMADDMAVRLKIGLGSSSTSTKSSANVGGTDITNTNKISSGFAFSIAPGIEKHFAGTDKLSPFVGAELPIAFNGSSTNENDKADLGGTIANDNSSKTVTGSRFGLGLNLVLGADYYFTDAVYLGVEGGLGIFSMTSTGDGTIDNTTGGVASPQVKTLGGSATNLFGVSSGSVRLGYKF